MDEIYVTYVDDEHVDNHDYDDTTDADHDNSNDIYVSGPDPGRTGTGPRPDRFGPGRTRPAGPVTGNIKNLTNNNKNNDNNNI